MSYTKEEISTIVDFQADMDYFISQRNWKEAAAVIQACGDLGFEHEALLLHQSLNRAKAEVEPMPMDERDLADRDYPRE